MKIIKLGEIAKIDISNVDKKIKDSDSPVVLCNFVDVYHNWAITNDLLPNLMKSTANENQISRFSIRKGQVAITKDSETRDDIGVSTYIADNIANGVLGYHCALITPDENILTGKYLNVVLHTPYAQKYFELNASGSGQRYTLTVDIIAGFPVPVPGIETQLIVGDFYSAIDKKLSNNNRINAELESMAKTIYDYWFTQFDFPDENGKPYRSSGGKMVWNDKLKREIPEGWEVKQIKDICCFENGDRGKNYPSGEDFKLNGIPFITGGAINENSIDYTNIRYIDNTKYDSLRAGKASYNDILLTLRGSLAKCVFSPFDKAAIASALVIVRPNSIINNTYLYHLLISTGFIQTCNNYNNGSVQANLSVEAISSFFVIVPSKNILEKYESLICKFNEAIMKHKKENIELSSLRDWLLPMLMNGQVGFKEDA